MILSVEDPQNTLDVRYKEEVSVLAATVSPDHASHFLKPVVHG